MKRSPALALLALALLASGYTSTSTNASPKPKDCYGECQALIDPYIWGCTDAGGSLSYCTKMANGMYLDCLVYNGCLN